MSMGMVVEALLQSVLAGLTVLDKPKTCDCLRIHLS